MYTEKDIERVLYDLKTNNSFMELFLKELDNSTISFSDKENIRFVISEGIAENFNRFDSDVCEEFLKIVENVTPKRTGCYFAIDTSMHFFRTVLVPVSIAKTLEEAIALVDNAVETSEIDILSKGDCQFKTVVSEVVGNNGIYTSDDPCYQVIQ